MEKYVIDTKILKLKKIIGKNIHQKNYNTALSAISVCAKLLYKTNIKYTDDFLESSLLYIAQNIEINITNSNYDKDIVVFYDGFGLNDRGLAQIYLEALCKCKKVCYVTYNKYKNRIPDLLQILNNYNCTYEFIDDSSYIGEIRQLDSIIKQYKPQHFFFYSYPNDVIATTLMHIYSGLITRYQINLTDHAFWLGTKCIDYCIEFREYGANISNEYRKIDENKIIIIPFYPILHKERKFEGFPFKKTDDIKVIFSGGSLYKTFSDDNIYYILIENILKKHKNVFFWYAGSGDDSRLKILMNMYPDRIYFTPERKDLFQILERCDIYLSTYPICGGLMFQYAACAGICPITLKNNEDTDGYLINQTGLNVVFENKNDLYDEIYKLLNDDVYIKYKSDLLKKSVISHEIFNSKVEELVNLGMLNSKVNYSHIDTEEFQNLYLKNITLNSLNNVIFSKKDIYLGLRYYPYNFIRFVINKIKNKIFKR